jgi:allophanate hydrolase subunit 2
VLPVAPAPPAPLRAPLGAAARAAVEEALGRPRVRAVQGPHAARFPAASVRRLFQATFRVGDRSDRMGMRLEGAPIEASPDAPATTLWTEGVPCGAVQVPGDGAPIVLLADGPPTGGYPVLACVATADLPRLGELRPREEVGFERVTVEEARAALREREAWLDREVPAS